MIQPVVKRRFPGPMLATVVITILLGWAREVPADPPMAYSASYNILCGETKAIWLSVYDSTVPYYDLDVSIVQAPLHGTVTPQYPEYYPQYGCFVIYTPTNGFVGTDSFTFKGNDGSYDSNIATVTLDVHSDQPPVATSCSITGVVGAAINILLPVTDDFTASHQLLCSVVEPPENGTVTLTYPANYPNHTSYVTYQTTNNFVGTDRFTFKANDGVQDSNMATCTVTVAGNAAPVADAMTLHCVQDSVSNIVVLRYTHADLGQPISFEVITAPANGALSSSTDNRTWAYTPNPGYSGPDSFTWAVSDSIDASTATVYVSVITLSEPGTPPVFKAGVPLTNGTARLRVFRLSAGGAYQYADRDATGPMAAPELADWNNDGLMDLLVGESDGRIALFINKGSQGHPVFNGYRYLKYPPGSDLDIYSTACSCFGGHPSASVPRVVDWNNDGRKDLVVGKWGAIGKGSIIGLDVFLNIGTDAAPIFASRLTCELWSTLWGTGTFPSVPASMPCITDINGDGITDVVSGDNSVWFSVAGYYGQVGTPTGLVNIFLGTKNDHGPAQGSVANYTDVDGNGGNYYIPSDSFDCPPDPTKPASWLVRPALMVSNVCPVASRKSVLAVDWDGDGKKDLVTGMQDGTVWHSPNVGTTAWPVFTNCYRLQAGGIPIVVGDPAKVGQDPGYRNNSGDYHGGANLNPCNEARLGVGDLDGDGLQDLVVGDVNGYVTFFQQYKPSPVAIDQQVMVMRNAARAITLTARMDNGNTLTFAVRSQPKHGTLSGSAPDLVYTPDSNYTGMDRFTFVAADGGQESQPGTVFITVKQHAPAALDQGTALATMNRPRAITLTAVDESDEPLTYSVVTPPAHGTFTLASNVLAYTSLPGYTGPDSFSWKANDGFMDSNVRTVSIEVLVLAVNFQPTTAPVPAGYVKDDGAAFDAGRGYGWDADRTGETSLRDNDPDPRVDTRLASGGPATWTCSLPNGTYSVWLAYGNRNEGYAYTFPQYQDILALQGLTVVSNPIPSEYSGQIVFGVAANLSATVTNGQLTVTIGGGANATRLDYLEIRDMAGRAGWASFVTEDSSTMGNWQGRYGVDGYWIPQGYYANAVSIPAYAGVAGPPPGVPWNSTSYTWADPTTDVRALQHVWGQDRIASCFGPGTFTLNLVDGITHRVALYCLDWENSGMSQTVEIRDALDNTLLDSRVLTDFNNGAWLVWDLKGHVTIHVIPSAGSARVSGLFFGAGSDLDWNQDGVPDWWQIQHFGSATSPDAAPGADPDGDGLTNEQEFLAGTDPTDPTSQLMFSSVLNNPDGVGLWFNTVPGVSYDVFWKSNLVDTSHWITFTNFTADGGPTAVTFTNSVPQSFFKIRVTPWAE